MSGTTSVPTVTFGPNGFIAPQESAILTGLFADLTAAFGGNLSQQLSSPQGQLASSEAAIIGDCNSQFLLYTNLVDPAYSSGRMQDAIARIYFLTRNPAQSTVIEVTCVGLYNVNIPIGALIQDPNGNIYSCTEAGTIPTGGSITLTFANQTTGPIAVPETVSIYQAIPGWDDVTVVSGVLGNAVETSTQFEIRRQQTVEGNSFGAIGSIIGAVAKVSGVLDYYGYDNATSAPVTVQGQTIAANSIFICVSGGISSAVAQAIFSKKSPGCGYTGNTTITVYDSNPLYSAPIPYSVTYEIPAALPIIINVILKNSTQVPNTALATIQAAIQSVFAGTTGVRPRIGSTIYASNFYPVVAAVGSWVKIISILVGSPNNPAATFTASISGTNMTVSAVASGTLALNQVLTDTTGQITPGTTIVSQSSGTTGGTGVYVVSNTLTVSSEQVISVAPNLNDLVVQINQIPAFYAANVILTLQ